MTLVVTENIVKDRKIYLQLAKLFVEDTKYDKGCHGMDVYIDLQREYCVVFVSKWDSKKDFLSHIQGNTFAKHISGMSDYYISGIDTFLEKV